MQIKIFHKSDLLQPTSSASWRSASGKSPLAAFRSPKLRCSFDCMAFEEFGVFSIVQLA